MKWLNFTRSLEPPRESAWDLISLSRRLKTLTLMWAIALFVLISVTGYYGGVLAH
jgi:hypothetical protein